MQPIHLGYEPIRAYVRERAKSVTNPETLAEFLAIVHLCDGLEHQEKLLTAAINPEPQKEAA